MHFGDCGSFFMYIWENCLWVFCFCIDLNSFMLKDGINTITRKGILTALLIYSISGSLISLDSTLSQGNSWTLHKHFNPACFIPCLLEKLWIILSFFYMIAVQILLFLHRLSFLRKNIFSTSKTSSYIFLYRLLNILPASGYFSCLTLDTL